MTIIRAIFAAALFLLLTVLAPAQSSSTFLDPTRAINWTTAGFTIPSYTTNCAAQPTLTANNTGAAAANGTSIQNALNSCDATHNVVNIPAGTYYVNALSYGTQGKQVLRGVDPNSTTLIPTAGVGCAGGLAAGLCMKDSLGGYNGSPYTQPGGSNACNWTAGYAQGTTTITLSGCGGAPPLNQTIILDQANDTADTGGVYVCDTNISNCGYESAGGGGNNNGRFIAGKTHSQQQVVVVTGVSGSGSGPYTVTISPGVYFTNIRSGQAPGAWWPGFVQMDGVENLTIDGSNVQSTIDMYNCYKCWVKNVRSVNAGRNHVDFYQSMSDVVRDSYFFGSQGSASDSYAMEFSEASSLLVENNIFQQVTTPTISGAYSGSVIDYNFAIFVKYSCGGNCPTFGNGAYFAHNAGNEMNLYEGNNFYGLWGDDAWGSSAQTTYFRNMLTGWQNGKSQSTFPILMRSYIRDMNLVGNVMGQPGYHNQYQAIATSTTSGTGAAQENTSIYSIGWAGTGATCSSGAVTTCDPLSGTTLMRWGNWDTVTNGTRWNSTEASPPANTFVAANFSTSYFNTLAQTLPPSLYYAAKPSWWPAGKAWPVIGPDITTGNVGVCSAGTFVGAQAVTSAQCTGGSLTAAYATHVVSIPAQDCFLNVMGGKPDGTGAVSNFNFSNCASSPPPPTLTSINVLPNPATLTTSTTFNMSTSSFCAFSDSSTIAAGLTGCQPVWTDTAAHSTINSSTGIVSGVSVGSDTITATIGSIHGTATANILVTGPAIVQKKFVDCSGGCTNPTITPTVPTTAGNIWVAVETSSVPIQAMKSGTIWGLLYSGMITNSDNIQWVSMPFVLNAPSKSTITLTQASFTGAIEFYEISGANAVDSSCVKQLSTPLATTTSKSVTCTPGHANELLIAALAGAPNTPTISGGVNGTFTVDATLAANKSIFGSFSAATAQPYVFGGTWTSGSGRPTITMAGFYATTPPNAIPPIFSPGTGHYGAAQSVTITSPTAAALGGVIHFSIGGTATCGSPSYSGPINVNTTQTITAIVCGVAGYNQSTVKTGAYAITGITTPQTYYVSATTGAGLYDVKRQTVGGSQGLFTGSAIGCTGTSPTSYPGSNAIQQNCPVNDWRFLFDDQTFNNSNPNTWLMQGGDKAIISGCATNPQNAGNTTAPDCRAGVDNNTGIGAGQTWCYGGGVNGCANPAMPSGVPIAAATACAISGGVGTITAPNTMAAGDLVMPDYFTTSACKAFNGQAYTVMSSGLSSSQFKVLITAPDVTTTADGGTVFRPTQLVGANAGACTVNSAKQVIFGGFGVGAALDLSGAQHVVVECLNITRHSQCIQFGTGPGAPAHCVSGDDYDSDGIHTSNSTSVFMQDMWIHGHPARGVKGPIGGSVTCDRCNIDTNGSAGWDFDDGFATAPDGLGTPGQAGTASINGQWNFTNSTLQWSGCDQQYPFVNPIPILACFAQNNQGYGDGVGSPPGTSFGVYWFNVNCMYNTQDCLDIGHADAGPSGSGYNDQTFSTYRVDKALAFANNGGNWKSGPNTSPATITNTVVVGNCQRMFYPITGTPSNFNANLSDPCRAGSNISLNYHSGGTITMSNNTFITYFPTAFLIRAWEGPFADPLTTLNFQNNITYGLQNSLPPLNLDYGGNSGGIGGFFFNTGGNPAEVITTNNRTNNLWYGVRGETCSGGFSGDVCADPLFVNEWAPCLVSGGAGCTFTEPTWDVLLPTVTPLPSYNITGSSPAINAGVSYTGIPTTGFNGVAQTSPPTIGANPVATVTPTVAQPTCTPAPTTFTTPTSVSCSSITAGSTTCGTVDGSTPTTNGAGSCVNGTSGPFLVSTHTVIKVIGTKSGSNDSAVGSNTYEVAPIVATPTSAPAPGPYVTAVSVTLLDSTLGATICYTLDGVTIPTGTNGVCTGGSLTYSTAIGLTVTTTIKAIGTINGGTNSAVGTFVYTINSVSPPFSAGGNIVFGGKITQ